MHLDKSPEPKFDLDTPDGGRGYIANLFKTVLRRHDYRQYISERLAGDFACTLAQHFEDIKAREAALQQRLTLADQRTDDLETKLSREEASHSSTIGQRDYAESMADKLAKAISEHFRVEVGEHSNLECPWANALSVLNGEFETDSDQDREVKNLRTQLAERDAQLTKLREALKFYADKNHFDIDEMANGWDTVSGEPQNILWRGDEPEYIEDGTIARAALAASAELRACGYSSGDWECRPGGYLFDAGTGEGYDPQDCTHICPHCRTKDFLEAAKDDAESTSRYSNNWGSGTGLDIWKTAEQEALTANQSGALRALSELGPVKALDDETVVLCNTQCDDTERMREPGCSPVDLTQCIERTVQRRGQSATAKALKASDWSGVPIGNKAIIAKAIEDLTRPAPIELDKLAFEFVHPETNESYIVSVGRAEVAEHMEEHLFKKLCDCFCVCQPVGETNVVDCCCDEVGEQFKLLTGKESSRHQLSENKP